MNNLAEKKAEAHHRLKDRIGWPPEYRMRLSDAAIAKTADALNDMLLFGTATLQTTADDVVIERCPGFLEWSRDHG